MIKKFFDYYSWSIIQLGHVGRFDIRTSHGVRSSWVVKTSRRSQQ